MDELLNLEGDKDYLNWVEALADNYSMEAFYQKQYHFGTIAMVHNTGQSPETVYISNKGRGQIEEMMDVLKNILEADSSYMN